MVVPYRGSSHSLGKGPRDLLRVTVDGVEEPGEAEAEHRAQEEHPEHHLLLKGGQEVHVWSEHGQDSQKEKQHKTYRTERREA